VVRDCIALLEPVAIAAFAAFDPSSDTIPIAAHKARDFIVDSS
jgi:hypothetical protein